MRVMFLGAGNSIHTVRWVNALAEKGHEVHLVYNSGQEPNTDNVSEKITQHKLKWSGPIAYYLNAIALSKLLSRVKPDIVNAHYASGFGTLARVARLKPLVLSVWGSDVYDFPNQSPLNMKIIKRNLLFADKLTSTSHCMADVTRKLILPKELNVNVVPFGVDIKRFSRSKPLLDKDDIIIGNIKTLSPKYGIDDLVRAIKILKDDLLKDNMHEISNRIKVRIYGDGEQKDELLRQTIESKLEATIKFMGKIPNNKVPEALEEMDIFCATSVLDSESFGVAVVEAMSMELPVVVTDVDGFKEVVKNNITGFIVRRRNPDDIARALRRLVMDRELRSKFGLEGRKRVLEHYNWEKNVNSMIQIYDNLKD
ncbi:glycosyltransferase [Paenibacillus sp.]|uniref:glycosyltransferase n=1 Tax=Paenibacillus sp. TaxID=58172 RepID=UPI002811A607|nr:glycosyltransferase [Paenibacillus sp.]